MSIVLCSVPHPEMEGVLCDVREDVLHAEHQCGAHPDFPTWVNEAHHVPEDSTSLHSTVERIARDARAKRQYRALARNNDPVTAHIAAQRINPRVGTRREAVLTYLYVRMGQWVPGYVIASPEVGGSEGLRRVRELREMGWPIEQKPDPVSTTAWLYRLDPSKLSG